MTELWTKLDPGFLAPIWLAVGAVAVVAILLLELGAQRRRAKAVRVFAASHLATALTASVSPLKRMLKRVLLISAVALLFVAMARPHLLDDWQDESRTGLDLLLAVDCSKSMLADDVKPNRIERAKLAISDFGDRLPDDRLGLIAFAGSAFLQCPLTLDHDAFQSAVRELDTDTIPRPGTDIATAIDEAVLALKSQSTNMKILILVTDGEDLEGRALDAAKAAKQAGLAIYTVGVGTAGGALIPERDETGTGSYHHDASGQLVESKLDEDTLRQIASLTGGAYFPLGQQGEGLDSIYNRYIATLPRHQFEERRERIRLERFEWPLAAAILFLIWEFLTNERAKTTEIPATGPARRYRRRPVLTATSSIAVSLMLWNSTALLHAANADTAERDYKSGKYEEALQNYRKASEIQPNRNDLQYDRGDAAYKTGEFTEAEQAFRKTLETPDLGLQENTYYNLGNTQFRHGEALQKVDTKKTIDMWEQALHSYDSSLKLQKTADAQHNYDLVKEKLEQLKQQQKQQQQKDKKSGSSSDKNDPSQQNSPQNQGKGGNGNPQQQPPGQNPQNGQNPSPQQGDNQDKSGSGDKDQPSSKDQGNSQVRAYSGTRTQDQQDPGVKSREEAEALLDSLKDDEKHVTARTLNGDNEPPPPPPSGKDW